MSHQIAGNNANFPVQITVGDDGVDSPFFSIFNTPHQGLADRTAWLGYRIRVPNFAPSSLPVASGMTGGGPSTVHAACWDWLRGKWVVGSNSTPGAPWLIEGRGDPSGWKVAGPVLPSASGGLFVSIVRGNDPAVSSKYIYASYIVSPGACEIARMDTVGGTFGGVPTPPLAIQGATDISCALLLTRSGVVIAAIGSSTTTGHTQVYSSSNQGGTWTAQSALTISSHITTWIGATNPSGVVVVMPSTAGMSAYLRTVDGVTWTSPTINTTLAANETPQSIVWTVDNIGTGCFLMTTYNTATTLTATYRSYDGITWAVLVNNLPIPISLYNLSWVSDPNILLGAISESPLFRVLFSLDGGVTWEQTNLEMNVVSGIQFIAAGPAGAIVSAGQTLAPSLAQGHTQLIGAV